jgi:hypothetical protein
MDRVEPKDKAFCYPVDQPGGEKGVYIGVYSLDVPTGATRNLAQSHWARAAHRARDLEAIRRRPGRGKRSNARSGQVTFASLTPTQSRIGPRRAGLLWRLGAFWIGWKTTIRTEDRCEVIGDDARNA